MVNVTWSKNRNGWLAQGTDRATDDILGFDGTMEVAQGWLGQDATDEQIVARLHRARPALVGVEVTVTRG